ncbi:MAG: hypothetical protein B6U76_00980 [Desulfurococcales archaeon ex4484_217_2]|nr:MAG: hypothetical protein B6U76_00980 [Desulfurococcales archaeon ex4484_217_2]
MVMRFIYLTELLEEVGFSDIVKMFSEVMVSVEPAYSSPLKFINVRKRLPQKVCWDSGGYAFLSGKLKQPPDPRKTIWIYKRLGYTSNDFLMQLDIPPYFFMDKQKRLELIKKNAEYYYIMKSELKDANLLPIIHGWTYDELEYSLSLIEDPDKVGLPSNVPIMAFGSYIAKTALKEVATPWNNFEAAKAIPIKLILDRLIHAYNLLKNYNVFQLGGGQPNTVHIAFLLGAKYADGSGWRFHAARGVVYIPGYGLRQITERGHHAKRITAEEVSLLREAYLNSPFHGYGFEEFLRQLKARDAFRRLWNAWALKYEEKIANEYANNPDRYFSYLLRRFEKAHPVWAKRLQYMFRRIKQPYVQSKLTIYIKGD